MATYRSSTVPGLIRQARMCTEHTVAETDKLLLV
jgi:hypothetical protein